MEFKTFTNGTDYLEYLQIFCFKNILIDNNLKFTLAEYNDFELTDVLVNQYNDWIKNGAERSNLINEWVGNNEDSVSHFKLRFGTMYKAKVSLWSDRNKNTYYKEKLQDAFVFENHIAEVLKNKFNLDIGAYLTPQGQYDLGENALGIEIKNDRLIKKYGNVYIEFQEKSNAGNYSFVNSGILKQDNCNYFLLGTEEQFYIFKKSRLIEIFYEEIEISKKGGVSKRGIKFKQIATSKGFVYPVRNATNDLISLEQMVEEIKNSKH
jgi:hypothetical protein